MPPSPICPRAPRPVELPESEAWAAQELSLPMFPELSDAEVERMARGVPERPARPDASDEEQRGSMSEVLPDAQRLSR